MDGSNTIRLERFRASMARSAERSPERKARKVRSMDGSNHPTLSAIVDGPARKFQILRLAATPVQPLPPTPKLMRLHISPSTAQAAQ